MTTASARTNAQGYAVTGEIDYHNLKTGEGHADKDLTLWDIGLPKFDGEMQLERLAYEDNKGLDRYSLLAFQMINDGYKGNTLVECYSKGVSGLIELRSKKEMYRQTGVLVYKRKI